MTCLTILPCLCISRKYVSFHTTNYVLIYGVIYIAVGMYFIFIFIFSTFCYLFSFFVSLSLFVVHCHLLYVVFMICHSLMQKWRKPLYVCVFKLHFLYCSLIILLLLEIQGKQVDWLIRRTITICIFSFLLFLLFSGLYCIM